MGSNPAVRTSSLPGLSVCFSLLREAATRRECWFAFWESGLWPEFQQAARVKGMKRQAERITLYRHLVPLPGLAQVWAPAKAKPDRSGVHTGNC